MATNDERGKGTINSLRNATISGNGKLQVGDDYTTNNYMTNHYASHSDPNLDQCLIDLQVTDPRHDKRRIEETKGGLLKDSYKWILHHEDFRRWRDDRDSRLLWIKGDPGKGKTMLLCGIVKELEEQGKKPLAYFFCQAADSRINNATAVLRGLIYLLLDQQPSLISHVKKRYKNAGKRLFEDVNAWVALSEIFEDIFAETLRDSTLLIIDALDECLTGCQQLLNWIVKISSECPRVKWIVSSRNWPDIEEKLDNTKQKVRLHLELNQASISAAVRIFIRHRVEALAKEKKYDRQTRDVVEQHLVSHANDTFLWVALVCQELADPKVRKRHMRDKLKSYPRGLDPLYERMMKHIVNSNDADLCKEILAIASVIYRPITLEELKVLVKSLEDFDQDDLEEIIGCCGSFLTLREGVIYFVHHSAKDFLLSKTSDQILPSGVADQHYAIFSRSLEALSKSLRRDIYNLYTPGFPIEQVSTPVPDPLASIRYSCIYWVGHLHDSEPAAKTREKDLQDGGVVHDFLQTKYLYWLEAISLMRSMSEGVMAMQKLRGLVRNVEVRELTELLRDAHRFILFHKRAIEIAPLQAYASALVFSPAISRVRKLFKKEEPDWMISKPSVEENWNACLQTLEGHGHWVISVAFSADGEWIASGSLDKTVKIWDAGTGACLQTLEGHSDSVHSVAISADGQWIASGSWDKTVKIWDAGTGACLQTLEGHGGLVSSVAFSADSQWIASGSHDSTVKIWDAGTGACLQTLEGHGGLVISVAFSADGQWIASGSYDKTVKTWDASTGACVRTLKDHGGLVSSVAFSPDSQWIASGSWDKTGKIWDATTGVCVRTLQGHSCSVLSIAFSADSPLVVSGLLDKTVKIWDASTGACLQTLEGHGGPVISVAFSADGQRVASGSYDKTVKTWDASTSAYVQTLERHSDSVLSIAVSADTKWIASSSLDSTVKIWDAGMGACLRTLEGHGGLVNSVAFSADGQRVASGSYDKTVKIWDAGTGACVQTLEGHSDSVHSVAISADNQQVASGSYDKTVKIWDASTGACLQTLKGHSDSVHSVVFSADTKWIASSSLDKTVKIWDAGTGACLQTLEGHGGSALSVAFSADSQWIASSSLDNTVKIWDAGTGACIQTLNVGRPTAHLWFDLMTNSRLSTDIGVLNLNLPPVETRLTQASLQDVSHCGYGISADGVWIVKDGEGQLWLPLEYRASESAVVGSTVAIGCRSGYVLVIKFSQEVDF
ncbi:hypothetical protein FNYG_15804 [Fusarium nygamai]|uniref:NACHT domain-containing protein n=1 Tax=Gibberella nygamai TaxID=42673 RepID=A0A2K0U4L5_GIBNY|nr:hypothetical protein FNYG_15804 [Fusarium nygamai]